MRGSAPTLQAPGYTPEGQLEEAKSRGSRSPRGVQGKQEPREEALVGGGEAGP